MNHTLAQVPPHQRGVPWRQYLMWEITRMCNEHLAGVTPAMRAAAWINTQKLWTPRSTPACSFKRAG